MHGLHALEALVWVVRLLKVSAGHGNCGGVGGGV